MAKRSDGRIECWEKKKKSRNDAITYKSVVNP